MNRLSCFVYFLSIAFFGLSCQDDFPFYDYGPDKPDVISDDPEWNPNEFDQVCADLAIQISLGSWFVEHNAIVKIRNIGNEKTVCLAQMELKINLIGGGSPIYGLVDLEPGSWHIIIVHVDDIQNICGVEAWIKVPEDNWCDEYGRILDCNPENNHALAILPNCIDIPINGG
ncbi:MAG: hypothetical protein R2806_19000 [Saprospiraceae bacterium]